MSPLRALAVSISLAVSVLPVLASSTASSVSSEGSSASVGSLSDSIKGSSESSSQTVVAQGPYRVVEIAALPDRSGGARVRLQALQGGAGEFVLLLPAPAAQQAQLAEGDVVQVRERGYGWQFARAGATEPFFLVLDDAVHRELQPRPVSL